MCTNCGCGQYDTNGKSLMQLAQLLQGNENQTKQIDESYVDEMIRNLPFGSGMRGNKNTFFMNK